MSPTQQRKATTSVPRPRRPAKSAATGAKEETAQEKTAHEEAAGQRGGMTLPVVHTTLPVPHVGLPAAGSVPGRVLWLGGLGTLAVFGALDWPVAVAIAAGTWVAEQRARERLRQEQEAR